MPRGHLLSIYARFSDKKRTSMYISREKGDHYYIQTRHNDLFFPFQSPLRKRYLFQASGTSNGRDFTKWSIWKRREICQICHTGVYTGQKSLHMHFTAVEKSRKRPGLDLLIFKRQHIYSS